MLKYEDGQSFTIKDSIVIKDEGENLMMLQGTIITIESSKEGVEYPYIVKFHSHDGYMMAMEEKEITDLIS